VAALRVVHRRAASSGAGKSCARTHKIARDEIMSARGH
jgi:hypothetical protein